MERGRKIMQRKGIALIHLTFEGLQVDGGGVCTVNRGHLAALPSVQQALASRGLAVTPFFCETLYHEGVPGYDAAGLEAARSALEAIGGDLHYVLNRTGTGRCISCNWKGGEDFFGTAENTLAASISGATLARNIAMRFEKAIVYCDDAAYVMAPLLGAMQVSDERTQWVWVVHSTSATHDARPLNPEKVGMETACVNAAREYPNIHLGAISRFIEDHLVEDYAAPRSKIIPTGNGVNPQDVKYRIRSAEEIKSKIEAVNRNLPEEDRIPLDKPVVFSFGRPVPYKRLDLTLRAAAQKPDAFHPVVITLGEYPELRALRSELGVKASIVNAFDFELVACLCQHERTLAVAILARNEPFGLIPSEARLLVRKQGGLLVVPSDGGGLTEQVADGKDGFVIQDPRSGLLSALESIRSAPADRIRAAGVDRVFSGGYTWNSRIMETLSHLFEDVAEVRKEVLLEITTIQKKGL
jgi:glycosyltransferase involved in cell wall biosynthesis